MKNIRDDTVVIDMETSLKAGVNLTGTLMNFRCIRENPLYSKKISWIHNQLRQELGAILVKKELME